jgi:hypothetical protein
MIDGKRKVSGLTLDELKKAIEQDVTVTTVELCEVLKCSEPQIGVYGRAGMYKVSRVKKNCWWKNKSINWVTNDYQDILKARRTRKTLVK